MRITYRKTEPARIAVPYYGTISSPPFGLSRLYFVAEVDIETRSVIDITLAVWDPKAEANLSTWLRQIGVKGIICGDANSQYRSALNNENIWIIWRQEGEVAELVEKWANGEICDGSQFQCGSPKNKWCAEHYDIASADVTYHRWSSERRI